MKSAPSFWTHDSDASDSDSHDAEVPVAGTPRVLVTPILIAVSLVVSILMVSNGVSWLDPPANDLVRWGANYGPLTTHGQQWRIVTAAFVNIDLIHLLANVAVLAIIGTVTERLSGAAGFAVLYLLSGIGANIVSLAWHPFVIVAGASTANFGLLGGLAAFRLLRPDALPRPRRKVQAWRVYAMLLAILPYGYTDRIDIGVHLAGLATGFLVGCGLARSGCLDAGR